MKLTNFTIAIQVIGIVAGRIPVMIYFIIILLSSSHIRFEYINICLPCVRIQIR